MTQPTTRPGYTPPSLVDLDRPEVDTRNAADRLIVSWGRYPGPFSPLAGNVGMRPPACPARPGGYTPPPAA
ncbi:hypothetical protein [Methylorubrum thiocyanatum]|uniref:hypothetical protein n=1 Tax=Methylorubrum thiocyanatum TaxID=47958 RepID=UPI0035C813B2